MGLEGVRPDDLLPILAIILVVIVIALGDVFNSLLPSRAIPASEEYTYVSASNPEEPKALPSLGDSPSVELSIIVPAFDETARLKPMIESTLEHLRSLSPHRSFEIIIVDDGSKDDTSGLALKLAISHAKANAKDEIRVVRLRTNRGKGGAVKHGCMHSRGERILFVDADGATRFSDLEALWKKMDELEEKEEGGPCIVIGSRAHLVNSEAVVKVCIPTSSFCNVLNFGLALQNSKFSHEGIPYHTAGFGCGVHWRHPMRLQGIWSMVEDVYRGLTAFSPYSCSTVRPRSRCSHHCTCQHGYLTLSCCFLRNSYGSLCSKFRFTGMKSLGAN
ncbi:dolichyl-phosphate beta-glucosyltransferase [Serendipita sp. 397]|nr:dolichyl-phosphate beta-glucosyltransferase [Serendipita sp. 397]